MNGKAETPVTDLSSPPPSPPFFFFSCLSAVPKREAGCELQPEAEGKVPAPPAGQTHRQAPAPPQGPPPPEEGAAGHERGLPQEVRVHSFSPSFCFFFCVELIRYGLMENLTDGPARRDVGTVGPPCSFIACLRD